MTTLFQSSADGSVYAQTLLGRDGDLDSIPQQSCYDGANNNDEQEVHKWFRHVERIAREDYSSTVNIHRPMKVQDWSKYFNGGLCEVFFPLLSSILSK